ncbi:MAG: MFS transporter [Salinivirgaceae bacterium]|jgi:PPP family 3-phenylpropionic acid transporter|nr:MFS transporter [Salinivirgaceae bacterium]
MIKVRVTNQQLIIKALFFLTFAALASWASYFYIFLKEGPGLTSIEIGIIAAFQQFNNIVVIPIWGILADRFGRKNTLLVSIGISTLLLPFFLVLEGAIAILLFMILLTLFLNPIISLLDTVALDYEEQSKGKTSYGELRLWASIGWASSSLITGLFIENVNLSIIFPVAASMYFLVWGILFFLYKPLSITKNLKPPNFQSIANLLRTEKKLFIFFIIIFIYSIFSAPIYLIINVYYHEIGATNATIGLAFAVQAISELPFFFYGKRLIKRYGAFRIFIFTMLATSLRMAAYGLNSSPNVAVGIGIIHGISIGLFFVSVIAFVHKIVPSQMRSSGQSLIYTFYAVGVAIGNLLVGAMDEYFSVGLIMLLNSGIIILLIIGVLVSSARYKINASL